jgi:putative acetyltransferase
VNIVIRPDTAMIAEITKRAFAALAISGRTELFMIDALRKAGALTLSLVAETDPAVVGHAAFSPVTVSDGSSNWYGLGPVVFHRAFAATC